MNGSPAQVGKALQKVEESLEKQNAHRAARTVGWVFLTAL